MQRNQKPIPPASALGEFLRTNVSHTLSAGEVGGDQKHATKSPQSPKLRPNPISGSTPKPETTPNFESNPKPACRPNK